MDVALDLVAKKSLRGYSLVSRFLLLAAVPMVFLGIVNLFFEKEGTALGAFNLAGSAVFFLVSYWFYRMSKRDTEPLNPAR